MKWLWFVALILFFSASNLEAQWLVPQKNNWMSGGDYDRPHPVHRTTFRALSVPPAEIQNWPFPNIDLTNSENFGQFEPAVAINPLDSNNIIVGLIDDSDATSLGVCSTTDGGATWSRIMLPQRTINNTFEYATDPSVGFDAEGLAFYTAGFYDDGNPNAVGLFQSTDFGNDWTQQTDAYDNPGFLFTDKYYMTVDRSPTSSFFGRIFISWVEEAEPGFVRIVCESSSDRGQTWSAPTFLTDMGHYISPVPVTEPDGTLLVAYEDYYLNNEIYISRSTDGGATFAVPQPIAKYGNLGPLFPNDSLGYENIGPPDSALAVNSFPCIALDYSSLHTGRAYMTWSGKGADSLPHIWLTISDNDGLTWSTPRSIDGDSVVNPHAKFFPWIAVDSSSGNVAIDYYSATMNTVPPKQSGGTLMLSADLYMAHSTDGGGSFATRRITNASFDPIEDKADYREPETGDQLYFFGDYIGLAAKSNNWYPVWCDARSGDDEIYASVVQPFAPLPVTNLSIHDTIIDGKTATALTWNYNPETTFGYHLPPGYQFIVSKDTSQLIVQSSDKLSFADTSDNIGSFYKVSVRSGIYHSTTDSISTSHDAVGLSGGAISSIRFSNDPATVGRQDEMFIDCNEDCRVSLSFYDELGREVGSSITDGNISSHHEFLFIPDLPGVRFFILKEVTANLSREITGKISVLRN